MGIEDKFAGLRERLDGRAGELRREAGGVLVEAVGKALYRLAVARAGNQPGLRFVGELKVC